MAKKQTKTPTPDDLVSTFDNLLDTIFDTLQPGFAHPAAYPLLSETYEAIIDLVCEVAFPPALTVTETRRQLHEANLRINTALGNYEADLAGLEPCSAPRRRKAA